MNVFLYGCDSGKEATGEPLQEHIFPRILWANGSNYFDYQSCSFKVHANCE